MNSIWTRRAWLTRHVQTAVALVAIPRKPVGSHVGRSWVDPGIGLSGHARDVVPTAVRLAAQAERLDPGPLQALALQAVEAARAAGAQYADARLTRVVYQDYNMGGNGRFEWDTDEVGVGVRVLVHGYWGFAASPFWEPDEVVRLARDAVAQATENAKGTPRAVDLGHSSMVIGTWATPIRIDPFAIPIEEKLDTIIYWKACAAQAGLFYQMDGATSRLEFARQERVVATSEGALFTQTLYESGGKISVYDPRYTSDRVVASLGFGGNGPTVNVHGLDLAGKGWELFLDAQIPEQFPRLKAEIAQMANAGAKPSTIGRYTLVCDGATMASVVESTLGVATQLDRALGYEADAGGTSFLDDPLAMVGHLAVAAPLVTLKANRSAPAQLATVQWDDEGVVPEPFTLVKDGVLTDFQTTREQAAWLAPYYHRQGEPVHSHGCAAAQDAHWITMQHMPNLSLEPSPSPIRLEDLVADVTDGLLIVRGETDQVDFQAKNGLLYGDMREIKNGQLGRHVTGGAVLFNTMDLWKHVTAVGGRPTQALRGTSQYAIDGGGDPKGQPPQQTSHSVQAVAAAISNQPLIDPRRKA